MTTDNPSIQAGHGITVIPSTAHDAGGAPAHYRITGFDTSTNELNHAGDHFRASYNSQPIVFMNGLTEDGKPNGITIEALLTVCRDRLECFQAGPFPHERNALALWHIEAALLQLGLREKGMEAARKEASPDA